MSALSLLVLWIISLFSPTAAAQSDSAVGENEQLLLPRPQSLVYRPGESRVAGMTAPDAVQGDAGLLAYFRQIAAPISTNSVAKHAHRPPAVFSLQPLQPSDVKSLEAYALHITPDSVVVRATGRLGRLRALQTLAQLRSENGTLPCADIDDAPSYAWRGAMIDVSRHFYPLDFLKQQVETMAAFKLNRLHLHLTDAAGWRMEILRYPRLTQLGAWRTDASWEAWWNGGRRYVEEGSPNAYGGYYTQAQLRELVAFAAERGVEIVPEIEMPAHSEEVLTAYPNLSCTHVPYKAADFCPGNPQTYAFLEGVLTEVMDVFPSRYLHLGGDEAGKADWKHCPLCRRRMMEEGIVAPADSLLTPTEAQLHRLQAVLMRHMADFLAAHGRRMMGWDEVVDPLLPQHAAVMVWRNKEMAQRAAALGHDVVLAPASHCYFDFYQDAPPSQPEAIGGYLPFDDVAQFPHGALLPDSLRSRMLGVQGNLWTEYVPTPAAAQRMLYPRLLALAEIGWCGRRTRPVAELRQATIAQAPRLRALGVQPFDLTTEVGQRTEALRVRHHLAEGATVVYHVPYAEAYPAAAALTLTDGHRGGWSYHDGRWQGFIRSGSDTSSPTLDVTLDLGRVQCITSVSADFMQVCNPEIFYPSAFRVATSTDGIDFHPMGEALFPSVRTRQPDIRTFRVQRPKAVRARYLRIQATPSAFGGWLFTDEIVVQ